MRDARVDIGADRMAIIRAVNANRLRAAKFVDLRPHRHAARRHDERGREEALRRLRWILLVFIPLVPAAIGSERYEIARRHAKASD